jgi:lysophospholipase L1-like esterase
LVAIFCASTAVASAGEYDPERTETYRVDGVGRVLGVDGRRSIRCPRQSGRTAVLLIAGQSNSANYGEHRYRSAYPSRVANFLRGKCYAARSPLLGADGFGGETWTLLADRLIERRIFDQVVLVTTAIGGTSIARWRHGGDLNRLLSDVVADVGSRYRVTHVLWHQGEGDLNRNTSSAEYAAGIRSLVSDLRRAGISAPVFVSIASKCGQTRAATWDEPDSVTQGQLMALDPRQAIFKGPDTNSLIPLAERYDGCHFARSGQEKFADAWTSILAMHVDRAPQVPREPGNHE